MELTGALSAIFTLIVLEVILSADNALILGVLVQRLPVHLRRKALFYGILGAYILRGLALLFASLVIQLWWAQALGAAYLLYIALKHFLKPEEAHAPALGGERGPVLEGGRPGGAHGPGLRRGLRAGGRGHLRRALGHLHRGLPGDPRPQDAGELRGLLLDRYPRFKHLAYLVVGLAGAKLAVAGWDKFAKEVLHRPELALGLDKEAFSLFILAVLLLGSLWATRKPAPA